MRGTADQAKLQSSDPLEPIWERCSTSSDEYASLLVSTKDLVFGASWPAYYDETSEALTTCIASLSPPFLLSGMDTLIYYCTRHIFLAHAAFYMLTCFNPSAEYEV
ncbi:hypothetical protein PCH_Pc16g05000 [Penicillium rubens Wisconsin 54-1255]|uniref:Uncharacterized protein n=1 Tax=Penicillium rubens (strain ATCC 28089 / DSM 1075 / NRRL 1951 / Wisconsin 54-1255) TaxID=500485 RepID=B6H9B0_PENRW|nr:hypothetical protein PCH_Pc16g05000 [Penicillium rubens Wisconsin 54-1255]